MSKADPTKSAVFKRVLGNLLSAKPKPHAEMKIGKRATKKPNKRPSNKKTRM